MIMFIVSSRSKSISIKYFVLQIIALHPYPKISGFLEEPGMKATFVFPLHRIQQLLLVQKREEEEEEGHGSFRVCGLHYQTALLLLGSSSLTRN